MKKNWSDILDALRHMLPEGKFKIFLEPLKGRLVQLSPERESAQGLLVAAPSFEWELRLTAANDFMASQVRDQFTQAIVEAGRMVLGSAPKLVVKAESSRSKAEMPKPVNAEELVKSMPTAPGVLVARGHQLDLPMALPRVRAFNPASALRGFKHSFDDFVVGPCNQLAHAAATNILDTTSPVEMVFLSAGAGLGKTHLTQAVGRALSMEAANRHVRMEYLTAEEFTAQFIQATRYKTLDEFKERFRELDMLLLEDVHFLRGKERTQEELLSTIKTLQSRGGRVVLTSSFAPKDLNGVDSQLVSRFCSGFVTGMTRPDRDTRLHILQEKARRQCIVLPNRVADLLADRLSGDVRLIESCLHNLKLQAQFNGHRVSEEMAMDVIRAVARTSPNLSIEDVVSLVCRSFDLTPAQLSSKSRRQNLVVARNTAFFLLRKHTDLTLEEIGDRFNRKHSTVIKGITAVEHEMSRRSALGNQIEHAVANIERSAMLA
ncbi:chromosomal replication initiator protein DnaA [Mailhella sp.]